jgi:uncharacterized repeat protein (TIGR03837 family)
MPPPSASAVPPVAPSPAPHWRWDIFCRVIDNHGDLGVCWRLSVDLAERGHQVRLWVDDARAQAWMAPGGDAGVHVLPWSESPLTGLDAPGDVAIEAFGCELPLRYQAALAHQAQPDPTAPTTSSPLTPGPAHRPAVWINLEYLSAEAFVERSHGLPSPVMSGPARGLTKWFFYPGFTARTGGLIREPHRWPPRQWADQAQRPPPAPAPAPAPASPSSQESATEPPTSRRHRALRVSLFCYEPPGLEGWLQGLGQGPIPIHLWVAAGRPQAAVRRCLPDGHRHGSRLNLRALPYLTQVRYDDLLRHCDLNVVRGEDSLVRAIWAGRPLIWHIYPQTDGAHHDKLEAFLAMSQAPATLADYHRRWNADQALPLPDLTWNLLAAWQNWALALRDRLVGQADLTTQLVDFVAGKR